jgi:hypothetical protein
VNSINQQTNNNFDVVLINDNLNDFQVNLITNKISHNVIVISGSEGYTPCQLRVQLIVETKSMGYDILVMGDFDDMFSGDRIFEVVRNFDESTAFIYNQIMLFGDNRPLFEKLPLKTDDISAILECNYLGLSNSALNLNEITDEIVVELNEFEGFVFDWFLFSILLLNCKRGKMIQNAVTYYRIHENNIAGNHLRTEENICKEISVKLNHYKILSRTYKQFNCLYLWYKDLNIQSVALNEESNTDYWWHLIDSKLCEMEENYDNY